MLDKQSQNNVYYRCPAITRSVFMDPMIHVITREHCIYNTIIQKIPSETEVKLSIGEKSLRIKL